jgi:hypothetical protein
LALPVTALVRVDSPVFPPAGPTPLKGDKKTET